MGNFISDDEIEKALHYLASSAMEAAKARAELRYIEDYSKILLALIMKERESHGVKTSAAQERDAYADHRYHNHIKAISLATENDAKMTFLRKAAEARIEAWRTCAATERAMKV